MIIHSHRRVTVAIEQSHLELRSLHKVTLVTLVGLNPRGLQVVHVEESIFGGSEDLGTGWVDVDHLKVPSEVPPRRCPDHGSHNEVRRVLRRDVEVLDSLLERLEQHGTGERRVGVEVLLYPNDLGLEGRVASGVVLGCESVAFDLASTTGEEINVELPRLRVAVEQRVLLGLRLDPRPVLSVAHTTGDLLLGGRRSHLCIVTFTLEVVQSP